MLVDLKILLRNLVLPPGALLLVAFMGAWLLARAVSPRTRRAGWTLLLGALAGLWVLAMPYVASSLSRAAQRTPMLVLALPPRAQAIVILGGGSARESAAEYGMQPAAGRDLLERLTYGAYLARRTSLPVLVTGTAIEADAMRVSLARDFGVQVRWVETRSRDTFENAQFSAPILREAGIHRILLVTSAVHEWRAAAEFTAAGIDVEPAPVRVWSQPRYTVASFLPSAGALMESTEALYELIGDTVRRTLLVLHLRRHGAG
ncbi:MAG: YdcF family protein [Proteobacteria bacterium]|nr:YdcF family protein [Pseudomonadota bacterium]